jgi:hypothetical protein
MKVPDPRAFLIHKSWLSNQIDRDPLKKQRDLHQAEILFEAIKNYLPQYELQHEHLKYLPKKVIDASEVRQLSRINGHFQGIH